MNPMLLMIAGKSWAFAVQIDLDRIAALEVPKKLRRRARTDSYFFARIDLRLGPQPRLAKVDRLEPVAGPRRSMTPSLSQERIP